MSTTTDRPEAPLSPLPEERRADRSTKRMLVAMLVILGIAALALLVLLLWLLRPENAPGGQAEGGYPIHVVSTIYGYGDTPKQLLMQPLGVGFDPAGNVWIADTGQRRVEEYTSDGDYIRTVGEEAGPGELSTPYGIAVDPSLDRVYVADYAAGVVQMYSASTGGYAGHLPADDQNRRVFGPNGFSPYDVDVVDGRVVVSSNDGIYFFDSEGHVVTRWAGTYHGKVTRGSELGMFNFPDSFAIDRASGRVFVADTLNRRVVALDENGNWLWSSGQADRNGKIGSFWQLPRGIQVGPDGNVYVVDTFRADSTGMGTGHIVVLSPDGALLSEFGRNGTTEGSLSFPEQLSAGPDGLWAIADRNNNRVVIFRLTTPYPKVHDLYQDRFPSTFVDLSGRDVSSVTELPTMKARV